MKKVCGLVFGLLFLAITFAAGIYVGKNGIPLFHKSRQWSIGIYTGESPFQLSSYPGLKNPVLTAEQVTDVPAEFVADPFMVKEDSTWYMFFEVMNKGTRLGDIGLAVSGDAIKWDYKQIVLDEPFPLSYPYVFKWQGQYYMIPEAGQTRSIRLYKATDFPTKWEFAATLLSGSHFVDSSIFEYQGRLWLFTTSNDGGDTNGNLRLFYADDLFGKWTEHPQSPVVKNDPAIARPGGRVLVMGDRVIRFTQDDYPLYGTSVRAFTISELTTTRYKEEPAGRDPIVKPSGVGWNKSGMHTIDFHANDGNRGVACVDGYTRKLVFGLKN